MNKNKKLFKNWQVKIITAVVLLVMFPVAVEAPATGRTTDYYNNAGYFLELDGAPVGSIKDFEGGGIYTDVINEQPGPDYFIKKHVGQPKYEEITIPAGTNMESGFYKWVQDTLKNQHPRKSGSIVVYDGNSKADRSYDFTDALISEISFPGLDAGIKEPTYMTVKFQPEYISVNTAGSGTGTSASSSKELSKQLVPSNFRLKIDGLSTNRIQKIDAITIKNELVTDSVGETRDYQNEPGKLSVSNLVVTVSEEDAQSFIDWNDDFVVKGNNDEAKEKTGTLEFLSTNNQDVMFKLTFEHLGIFKLSREKGTNSLKAEMYIEKISFDYPPDGSDSLGTIDPDEANNAEPLPSASPTATGQTTQTVYEQTTTETPSIVTLQGKLTSTTEKPVETGSVQVIIKDLSGEKIWWSTFDGAIEKGEFNIPLGAEKELILAPGTTYTAIVEIDADSAVFSKADVTFGDGSPAGDTIRFKV